MNRDDTDALGIVAAVSWAKTNAPACPEVVVRASILHHAVFGSFRILARQHLHEAVALVPVDNASLNFAKVAEDATELAFGARHASNK